MVWCGVMWCDVVWRGVVWRGVVWWGVMWSGVVWCSVFWCACGWVGGSVCADCLHQDFCQTHHLRQNSETKTSDGYMDMDSVTLRAPLSGTFPQTLPDLVTPLKGHSLSPRSCPPTRSAPSERFEY